MSVLNRPMFNRTSTVVNRKDGSPERGEVSMNPEPFLTNLFQLFKRLNPNYDAETDEFRQEKFQEERDQAKFKALGELFRQIKESDPESVLREGEFATKSNTNADPELVDLYNSFLYLIKSPYAKYVDAVQSFTLDVVDTLSNFIVVLKSLTRSFDKFAYAFAVSLGVPPVLRPPVIITVGVAV